MESEKLEIKRRLIIGGIPLLLLSISFGAVIITKDSIFVFTTTLIGAFFLSIYNIFLFKLSDKWIGIAFIVSGIYFIISAITTAIYGSIYNTSNLEIILMFMCGIWITIMGSSFFMFWRRKQNQVNQKNSI